MKHPLRLYANGALTFDPDYIGRIRWPNSPTLPADCNRFLTQEFLEIMVDDRFAPYNISLRPLCGLTGVLAFNLSYTRLARSGLPGFILDPSQPLVNASPYPAETKVSWKDLVATFAQAFLLRLIQLGRSTPRLTASAEGYYPPDRFGRIFRLRRIDAVPRVFRPRLRKDECAGLQRVATRIMEKFLSFSSQQGEEFDQEVLRQLSLYVSETLKRAWQAYRAYQMFFGKIRFSYYERSLVPYHSALIAAVATGNGGPVFSTYHGVCQTASEPDIVTMAYASTFLAPTEAFADDARELQGFLPDKLRPAQIENYNDDLHYRRFLKKDKPRQVIKTVAIIGRHIVMRYSAFNMLEFPYYLDLEKKLGQTLADAGFQVVYKAHPESDWRHFEEYFDPRIKIDWRPFEKVMNEFDATIFHFGASSTLPHILGSHQALFMIEDDWHEKRIWPNRLQRFFKEYATFLPGRIGENGLIEWDKETILGRMRAPLSINPEQRLRDFFTRRYV